MKALFPRRFLLLPLLLTIAFWVSGYWVWKNPVSVGHFLKVIDWSFWPWLGIAIFFGGRYHFGRQEKTLPWGRWLLLAYGGLLLYAFITLGLFYGFIDQGPERYWNNADTPSILEMLKAVLYHQYWSYPVSAWGIWACLIGYVHYVRQSPPIASELAKFIYPSWISGWVAKFTDVVVFNFTAAVILSMVVCSAAITAQVLCHYWEIKTVYSMPFLAGAGYVLFFPLFSIKGLTKKFFRSMNKFKNPFVLLFVMIWFFLVVLTVFVSHFSTQFISLYGEIPSPIANLLIERLENQMPTVLRAELFFRAWLLVTIPLMGSFYARISQGRSFRALFGLLLLPIIAAAFGDADTVAPVVHLFVTLSQHPMFFALGLIIVPCMIVMGSRNLDVFNRGCFPLNGTIIKSHAFSRHARFLCLFSLALMETTIILGWYGLQGITTMGGIFACYLFLPGMVGLIYLLFQEQYLKRMSSQVLPDMQ